ncbi:MAG TPA: ABC transporter ATP-binding protein [Syntrophaceticus sp.]|nr:ABC transporter ATP-binding protein [Syntrophaceticus sp.]
MLKVNNINAFYGDVQILFDITLEVKQGEIVTLLGSNGAGKTTTVRAITNINPVRTGEIYFDGERIDALQSHAIAGRKLAVVPEGRHLFPNMTVKDNLLMGAYSISDKKAINEALEEVVQLLPRLKERFGQLAGTLSGGEQQMCAIGRAMMIRPKFIILDEPSLGLAPVIIDQIVDTLEMLRDREKTTILLIEQNAKLALEISDRAYVLENGRVVLQGNSSDLLASEDIQKAYLGI